MIAPFDADAAHMGGVSHGHVEHGIADHHGFMRLCSRFKQCSLQHGRMRLGGVVVGGLQRDKMARQAVGGEAMLQPAPRHAGGDTEQPVFPAQGIQQMRHSIEQRLLQFA